MIKTNDSNVKAFCFKKYLKIFNLQYNKDKKERYHEDIRKVLGVFKTVNAF